MTDSYKGWEVTVSKKETGGAYSVVGKARSMSFEVSTDLTGVYGVGYRDARVIKEGQREITGSIEHFFVDSEFYNGITGDYQAEYVLKAEVGTETIEIEGVKFDTWSLDLPQDDFLIESIDFTATSITWT